MVSMQDVFKKVAAKYAGCMYWKCFENHRDDKKAARKSGRRALKQLDARDFARE